MPNASPDIVVTGDVLIERRLARSNRFRPHDQAARSSEKDQSKPTTATQRAREQESPLFDPYYYLRRYEEVGGAALLGKLIKESTSQAAHVVFPSAERILKKELTERLRSSHGLFWNVSTIAERCPKDKTGAARGTDHVWRVIARIGTDRTKEGTLEKARPLLTAKEDDGSARLVVLEHLKQGFAESTALWPRSFSNPQGEPWLLSRWSDRTLAHPRAFFGKRSEGTSTTGSSQSLPPTT